MTHRSSRLAFLFVGSLSVLLLNGCIERKAETQNKKESPVSAELLSMLEEHQQMRSWKDYPVDLLREADLRHRQTVYQLLAQALIVEPADLYRAAVLLQSSDSSSGPEEIMLAYYCALESARKGNNEARHLSAEYLDKYLIKNGLPQKYGTQNFLDSKGSRVLYPFDSSTTDADRANWNVPSLDSLKLLLSNK